jgi:hypothetical protein
MYFILKKELDLADETEPNEILFTQFVSCVFF